MDPDILKEASNIVSDLIKGKDAYEKIAIVLKVIPLESFDEAFRFFTTTDRELIQKSLERKVSVNSVETKLVVEEFIKRNNLLRYLKTTTLSSEETFAAFQKFAGKNPRKVSQMLEATWLDEI